MALSMMRDFSGKLPASPPPEGNGWESFSRFSGAQFPHMLLGWIFLFHEPFLLRQMGLKVFIPDTLALRELGFPLLLMALCCRWLWRQV